MADSRSVSSDRAYSSSSSSYVPSRVKPMDKLKGKKSLVMSMMPSFIQGGFELSKNYERNNSYKPRSPEENSPTFVNGSDSFAILKDDQDRAKRDVKKQLEFSGSEFGDRSSISDTETFFEIISKRDRQERVLKYWNMYLTVEEIQGLKGLKVSRNLIDFSLSIFQKMNKDLIRKDSEIMKVLIASTSFSWKIFNQHSYENLHFNDFCLAYQVILFPIFIGYWTLLVVWMDEKKVHFHDVGLSGQQYLKDILINCYRFLHQEFSHFQKSDQIMKQLNTLTYEKQNNNFDFKEDQSELFILLISKKICTDVNSQNSNMNDYLENISPEYFGSSLTDLILKESEDLHSLIPRTF